MQTDNDNENLLHAALSWWKNSGAEALLFNQIWTRKSYIEADKIIHDLIRGKYKHIF